MWDRNGIWHNAAIRTDHHKEDESSNWKEGNNLTLKVEDMVEAGALNGAELFIFTYNTIFRGTCYKGHLKLKKLNVIIVRPRMVEMKTGCIYSARLSYCRNRNPYGAIGY